MPALKKPTAIHWPGPKGAAEDDTTMPIVLLIDDNEKLSHFSARYLELRIPDAQILTAGSLKAAQEILSGLHPDVIVLDWSLPDGRGQVLLDAVRQSAPGVPLLVITADPTAQVIATAQQAGAAKVVGKPYDIEDLAGEVHRLLSQVPAEASDSTPTPTPSYGVDETPSTRRHRILNRLAGLLAGMRAFEADLRAEKNDPQAVEATVDLYVERLIQAIKDVSEMVSHLTGAQSND